MANGQKNWKFLYKLYKLTTAAIYMIEIQQGGTFLKRDKEELDD